MPDTTQAPAMLIAAPPTVGAVVWVSLLTLGFLAVCVVMILTVLIQRPQGGGLSGAFGAGGQGAGQTAFGAKTGDVLTMFTIAIFVVYLLTAVGLNFLVRPSPAERAEAAAERAAAEAEVKTTDPSDVAPGEDTTSETDSGTTTNTGSDTSDETNAETNEPDATTEDGAAPDETVGEGDTEPVSTDEPSE